MLSHWDGQSPAATAKMLFLFGLGRSHATYYIGRSLYASLQLIDEWYTVVCGGVRPPLLSSRSHGNAPSHRLHHIWLLTDELRTRSTSRRALKVNISRWFFFGVHESEKHIIRWLSVFCDTVYNNLRWTTDCPVILIQWQKWCQRNVVWYIDK